MSLVMMMDEITFTQLCDALGHPRGFPRTVYENRLGCYSCLLCTGIWVSIRGQSSPPGVSPSQSWFSSCV